MSKINFPKKQEQRLIPKYLLEYAEELQENHPDPSASWGGGSGGDYTAGDGIDITENVISVDTEVVATKEDIITSYNDLTDKPDLSVYELKSEAFSGDYDDLTDKPDLSVYELKSEAFSGDYNDLTNKPTIPTDTLDLTNGAGYITGITSSDVITALGYTPGTSNFSGNYNDLTNKPDLTVYELKSEAFSGDYNDLTNKPTLFSGNYNDLTNKPDLSIYAQTANLGTAAYINENALSIDYNQLTNTPTIPTVNDPTITFTQGGVSKGTITLNQSSNQTIALDAGGGSSYTAGTGIDITSGVISVDTTTVALKTDIPTVPTNVSAFTNDAGYITSSAIPTNYVTTDTNQNITGEKTFVGTKRIKFKQNSSTDKLGFTLYNSSSREKGYLEYNPSNDGLYLGRFGAYAVAELGFQSENAQNKGYKLLVPNITSTVAPAQNVNYIPVSVNGTKADSTGNITIAIPDVSNYYTKTEVDNLIPTVPTNVSAFNNDAGYITNTVNNLTNYTLSSSLATVATSGSYNDLSNKPNIPTYTTLFSTTPTTGTTVYTIELSDSVANYDEIIIYYYRHNSTVTKASLRLDSPTVGDLFYLVTYETTTNPRLYTKADQFTITDATHIDLVNAIQQRIGNNEATTVGLATNEMRCKPYKVVGIKY